MKNIIKATAEALKSRINAIRETLGLIGKRVGYHGIKWHKENGGLKISELSGKLEGMHSTSTSPETSSFCERMSKVKGSICEECFSRRSIVPELGGYKNGLRANLIHNGEWLSVERTIEEMPELNDLYHRIESHGDVENVIQAKNFIRLCLRNPETHFTAWTKNVIAWDKAIAEMGKPENLIMVYSSPMKNREVKFEDIHRVCPWVDKVFTVYELEYLAEHEELVQTINCGSKQCLACKLCYKKNDVTQIREVKK